jgi:hypothetical protein
MKRPIDIEFAKEALRTQMPKQDAAVSVDDVQRAVCEYFNLKMADSIQEWRKRWFYVSDEPHDSQVPGLPEFNANAAFTKKRSWRPLVEKASFVPVRKGHSSRSPNRDGAAGTNASPHSSRPCYEPG